MNNTLEKLKKILVDLESEKGPILVFALFLRVDPLEKWDIVISASWLDPNDISSYKIISEKIQKNLSPTELVQLARIVILANDDPVVLFLQNSQSVLNGHFGEVSGDIFSEKFGFSIKKAYLLRCQPSDIDHKNNSDSIS